MKQNKQTKRKESWYFSLFVSFETPHISFACFAHQYFHLKSVITERIRGVDIRTLLFFNQLILNFMNFIEYHVALTMLTLLLIVTLITNFHSDTNFNYVNYNKSISRKVCETVQSDIITI